MTISVRTLLALSNPACEPEFRKLLEKRIRTRETREELERFTQRVRKISGLPLRSPELVGGSEELDPNLVAEYLDHQLSAEEERHFESIFLSSDVFLAELVGVSSILTQSLGQAVEIPDKFRMRLYEIGQETPPTLPVATSVTTSPATSTPVLMSVPTPPEKDEVHEIREKYVQKNLQESLDEWKWERRNRLKNIIVSLIFLVAGLYVWNHQDAINRFAQKFRTPEKTAGLYVSSGEITTPMQSVLESVEWDETPGGLPFYTQLEKPESVLEKTDPKPLNSPTLPPLFNEGAIRPASY